MKDVKIPFSSFDIFSNFIPPFILCSGVYVLQEYSKHLKDFIGILNNILIGVNIANSKNLTIAIISLTMLLLIFCLGHTLMALSSLIIDRIFVGKGFGYPIEHLLKFKKTKWKKFSNKFYKTICFMILIYTCLLLWFPYVKIIYIFLIHLATYIVLKILLTEARGLINKDAENAIFIKIYNHINNNIKIYYSVLYVLTVGSAVIVEMLFNLVCDIFRMHPFKDGFISNFEKLYENMFKLNLKNEFHDYDSTAFWLPYCTTHNTQPNSSQSLSTIRTMVYFSRSLSMVFAVMTCICIAMLIIEPYNISISIFGSITLSISVLFFIHYYNMFYNYYTKQMLRNYYASAVIKYGKDFQLK